MNKLLISVFWVLMLVLSLPAVQAQESGWPRTLPLEQGTVTIYQLQVDELRDDIIHFRAALAYRATADSEPVFGAGWFESPVEIDSSSRIVHPTNLKVLETRFPAGTDDVKSELSEVLAQQSASWNLDFTVDELKNSLATADAELQAAEKLNTAPPKIVYRDHPALLLSIDGDPVLREIEDSSLQAVINTPYPLIFDGRHYYLNAAKNVWYRSGQATGPYQFEAKPPAEIAAIVGAEEPSSTDVQPAETYSAANAPEIVVSTEPAELIVTEGPAAFVPLVDDLLVLQNSDDDVFMHVASQKFYIVLSGRWYGAASLNGPWNYQPSDQLPAAFASIPEDSNQADSRVYVAGTAEAREAVLDASVPQTASVARGVVDIDVQYDGQPIYEPVDGTDLVYIRNTGSTVLLADGLYYLVEDGVWYVSATPDGPWEVATQRPAQVDSILPTSPVHNVKYVQIYDSTPEVVYVGYTPGYIGSYVYHDTIFYGSGWYYDPWISPYFYYPRHSSWGFNVGYNPWGGWSFGLSWGWGPFSFGWYSGGFWHHSHHWHNRHWGYWGPRGYRGRPGHHGHGNRGYASNGRGHNRGGHNGNNGDYGDRTNPRQRGDNLYRDGRQRARIADTRDNRSGMRDGQRDFTRPANGLAASNSGDSPLAGLNKDKRSKARPVSPSTMRQKANVRDANFSARKDRLLADNSGRVYRGESRDSSRKISGSGTSRETQISLADYQARFRPSESRREAGRQTPAPVADNQARQRSSQTSPDSSRKRETPDADKQARSQRSRTGLNSSRHKTAPAADKTDRQTTSLTDLYSSRQTQSQLARKQERQRLKPSAQASSGQTPTRGGTQGVSQQPSRKMSKGIPLPQTRKSSKVSQQRPTQVASTRTAAPVQNRTRSGPAPQRSSYSGSRPSASAGQRSSSRSSSGSQRSRSSSSASRSGGSRPRKG